MQDNLNKSNFEEWLESHDIKNDSALAKELNTFVETANKIRLDESKKTIDEWERLLEKYAEYEHKRTLIIQKAKHERDIAIQKNASKEVLFSIDNRESQELAKLDFEQFQKTPTWMAATSDVANLANSAINELVSAVLVLFAVIIFSGEDQIPHHPHFIRRSMFSCLQCLSADIQTHVRHSDRFVCCRFFFCPHR